MQKKFNTYTKYQIYQRLMKEDYISDKSTKEDDEILIKEPNQKDELADVQKKIDDNDMSGIIDPKLINVYNKIMDKFEPQQLIFDAKEAK
jgi:hypothetical protein